VSVGRGGAIGVGWAGRVSCVGWAGRPLRSPAGAAVFLPPLVLLLAGPVGAALIHEVGQASVILREGSAPPTAGRLRLCTFFLLGIRPAGTPVSVPVTVPVSVPVSRSCFIALAAAISAMPVAMVPLLVAIFATPVAVAVAVAATRSSGCGGGGRRTAALTLPQHLGRRQQAGVELPLQRGRLEPGADEHELLPACAVARGARGLSFWAWCSGATHSRGVSLPHHRGKAADMPG
jgi:hypothetical protein